MYCLNLHRAPVHIIVQSHLQNCLKMYGHVDLLITYDDDGKSKDDYSDNLGHLL